MSVGRDHGNAPYHVFLKMANPDQGDIKDWNDLINIFTEEVSAQSQHFLLLKCLLYNTRFYIF